MIRAASTGYMLLLGAVCGAQQPLDCSALQNRRPFNEQVALTTAPHGAKRLTEHRLAITWLRGTSEFLDVAPYGIGAEEGVRHSYCGFDRKTAMHLVYRFNGEEVDGLLLDDSTGAVLPAGYVVLYAPDRTHYLAVVQVAGRDGEDWRLYSRNGQRQLDGPACLSEGEFLCRTLANPRWHSDSKLEADAICGAEDDQQAKRVTVRQLADSAKWAWTPNRPCNTP